MVKLKLLDRKILDRGETKEVIKVRKPATVLLPSIYRKECFSMLRDLSSAPSVASKHLAILCALFVDKGASCRAGIYIDI